MASALIEVPASNALLKTYTYCTSENMSTTPPEPQESDARTFSNHLVRYLSAQNWLAKLTMKPGMMMFVGR